LNPLWGALGGAIHPGEIRCAKLNTLRSDFVYFTRQAVAIANFTGHSGVKIAD